MPILHADDALPDPLFQSHDVLDVRLTAPITTLMNERPFESELPATFEITNSADATESVDIQIRTRGRFRRREEVCRFPPLRLNFKKSIVKDTLLHKQDKVKLVTHCMTATRFEQNVLKEYLAYRILNEFTDNSFRVRLLRITYVDNEGRFDDITRLGFVIEYSKRLAKRIGGNILEMERVSVADLDPVHTNQVSLFHYLIGNTDYSPVRGVPDEPCCHNHVLLGSENLQVLSIPYDFDQSGLVNAPYAAPNPRFGLRNVKQRLYRGRCEFNEQIPATLAGIRTKRESVMAIIGTLPDASKATTKALTKYVAEFFDKFETDKRVNSALIKKCV